LKLHQVQLQRGDHCAESLGRDHGADLDQA
jgi:hypothetical protein